MSDWSSFIKDKFLADSWRNFLKEEVTPELIGQASNATLRQLGAGWGPWPDEKKKNQKKKAAEAPDLRALIQAVLKSQTVSEYFENYSQLVKVSEVWKKLNRPSEEAYLRILKESIEHLSKSALEAAEEDKLDEWAKSKFTKLVLENFSDFKAGLRSRLLVLIVESVRQKQQEKPSPVSDGDEEELKPSPHPDGEWRGDEEEPLEPIDSPIEEPSAEEEDSEETIEYELPPLSELSADARRAVRNLKDMWISRHGKEFPEEQFEEDLADFVSFIGPYISGEDRAIAEANRLARAMQKFGKFADQWGYEGSRMHGALRKLPDTHGAKRIANSFDRYKKHVNELNFIVQHLLDAITLKEPAERESEIWLPPKISADNPFRKAFEVDWEKGKAAENMKPSKAMLKENQLFAHWKKLAGIKKRKL